MIYGVLLPVASLMSTLVWIGLFVLAALTAGASLYFFTRARHRESVIPARDAETSRAVSEMRTLGDRIETIVSQQQLQGETQRARLGQQIEDVQQTVSQQGHRVDGLRKELQHEVQRRDAELASIRQQLSDIQSGSVALPAPAEMAALPPAAEPVPQPVPASPMPTPQTSAVPAPSPLTAQEPSGDSFAGADALPPPPPVVQDPFAEAATAPPAAPAPPTFDMPAPAPEPAAPTAPVPGASMFSDMGFDAFAPGEPAGDPFAAPSAPMAPPEPISVPAAPAAPAPQAPEPAPQPVQAAPAPPPLDSFAPAAPAPQAIPAEAPPAAPSVFEPATFAEAPSAPDGGAWIAAPRAQPEDAVPVFSADDWDVPVETAAPQPASMPSAPMPPAPAPEPEPAPTDAFVAPPDADDFLFISSVNEDVQRALYMAGVTKLEEVAHWSRGDARRVSAQVGVSEETIMNQWVFEAQGALFERYSSGVGG